MSVAGSSGMNKRELMAAVNAVQKRMNVDIEIATLLTLRDKGIDVSEYVDAAYELIANR
jgi:hypothetical protein